MHPGSARLDEHVGDAEDRAPVIGQCLCDRACRPPGGNGESGGDLGDRPVVAVGLERGDGAVHERLDQFWVSARRLGARMAEGQKTANGVAGAG